MLNKITIIGCVALVLIGTAGCSKTNPLANKVGMDNLLYVISPENEDNWSRVCELYFINPEALRYKRHKEMCSEQSAKIYNKYKDHTGLAGATLDDFRDSKVWEMANAQYPNRSFR